MNKSEELAKLLGIKSKIRQIVLSCKQCQYKSCANCPNTEIAECPVITKKVYPDFTNPSNFVKLLEMKTGIAGKTIGWEVEQEWIEFGEGESLIFDRKTFLKHLLTYLIKYDNENESIKQQAQQIEWEWQNDN